MSVVQLRNSIRKAQESVGITPVLATDEQLQELASIQRHIAAVTEGLKRLGVVPDVEKQERDREAKLSEVQRKIAKHQAVKAARPVFDFTKLSADRAVERRLQAELAVARGDDCGYWGVG